MAESTIDTIRNRPQRIDDQLDAMTAPPSATPAAPAAPATPVRTPPQESSHNASNKLPESEGIFHRIVRGFTGG